MVYYRAAVLLVESHTLVQIYGQLFSFHGSGLRVYVGGKIEEPSQNPTISWCAVVVVEC